MNIYVGNLPYNLSEEELQNVFAEYGAIDKVTIIMDRETGQSKGFGFIEMTNDEEAERAIEALNGAELKGRSMKVNQARPRPERSERPQRRRF